MSLTFKTEISPTEEQKIQINKTLGVVRYLQNLYIETNQRFYKFNGKFLSANTFDKWYRKYHVHQTGKYWIEDVYSKARKQGLKDTEEGYIRFFKKLSSSPPKFKKKNKNNTSMYFVRNGVSQPIECERHRIKIPTLGWVRLKEKGYIPTKKDVLLSGRITKQAGRYYVSVILRENASTENKNVYTKPIGIDLGISNTAILSTGKVYKNINYSNRIKRLEKQLRKQQRKLSRKYESLKTRKTNEKEEAVTYKNINKQILKVQKLHQRLTNIRDDYQNKVINEIVRTKPSSITLEKLSIRNMLKNKYLSKSISNQKLYTLKDKLIKKAKSLDIEIRETDRFYPSSKLCSGCGSKKEFLGLHERIYLCNSCGLQIDRDLNASYNLRDAKEYVVI